MNISSSPIHPGEILLEHSMKPLGLTQYRLAQQGNRIWIFYPLIFANLRELVPSDQREFVELSGFLTKTLGFAFITFSNTIALLAQDLGVTPIRISQIVNGKRSISVDTAMRLARYFGTSAALWLRLQVRYDREVAEWGVRVCQKPQVRS